MTRRFEYDPGALNQPMQLLRLVSTPDGCGGLAQTYELEGELWAALKPLPPLRQETGQRVGQEADQEIVIRHRDNMETGWQLKSGERRFRIITFYDPDARRRYLICNTREEVA